MEQPREYPGRLRHDVPGWVKAGAVFHVRIRVAPEPAIPLTEPALAAQLLAAVKRYHESGRWWCRLVVLMPDHLHAMLSFPEHGPGMAATVRDWKRGTARFQGVEWQTNFFRSSPAFGERGGRGVDLFRQQSGGEGISGARG